MARSFTGLEVAGWAGEGWPEPAASPTSLTSIRRGSPGCTSREKGVLQAEQVALKLPGLTVFSVNLCSHAGQAMEWDIAIACI